MQLLWNFDGFHSKLHQFQLVAERIILFATLLKKSCHITENESCYNRSLDDDKRAVKSLSKGFRSSFVSNNHENGVITACYIFSESASVPEISFLSIEVLRWHPFLPKVGFIVIDQQIENATKPMHKQKLKKEKLENLESNSHRGRKFQIFNNSSEPKESD